MLKVAKGRGFASSYVLFDGWYSSLENLKTIRGCGWHFLTRLKGNRLVNPDRVGNVRVSSVEIQPEGGVVHLKGFGMIRVFRIVSKDGDVEHWATDDLNMKEAGREVLAGDAWGIEVFHRGIKQCCGIERAQVRKGIAVFNHICMSIRAFLRLEVYRLRTGLSWYKLKARIIRDAIRAYLADPFYLFNPTA